MWVSAGVEQGDDGEISTVVHSAGVVLAAGFAGPGAVSDRVADPAAVPDSGDCGGRCVRPAARNSVSARADIARSTQRLSRVERRTPAARLRGIVEPWAGRQFARRFRFFLRAEN